MKSVPKIFFPDKMSFHMTDNEDQNSSSLNVKITGNNLVKDEKESQYNILKRIKEHKVPIHDYIRESHLYKDIEIRTNTDDENSIKVNRIVLSAASPFLKRCLDLEDESQIIVEDYSFQSLSLAMEYLHFGYVQTTNERILKEVKSLVDSLEIGKSIISNSNMGFGAKYEPFELMPDVKIEPVYDDEEMETDFASTLMEESKVNIFPVSNSRNKIDNKDWKNNILSRLYEDEADDYVDNDNDIDEDSKDIDYKQEPKEKLAKLKPKKHKKKKEKNFDCAECDKKFSSKDILYNHMYKKHSNPLIMKCEHCPKTFTRLGDKNAHEQIHTRPFKCDQCGASFGRKSNLDGHMRLHTGERPYICDICGKGFPMQSNVTTHKKQSHNNGKKDWPCDQCERRYQIHFIDHFFIYRFNFGTFQFCL